MKNKQSIATGFVLLALLGVGLISTPAMADNENKGSSKGFLNAQASLKADAFMKAENATGVVLGSNNSLRVMGAKVTSVSGSDISATVPFGNSSLNFVVKTDAETKLNGKVLSGASALAGLKAGDKISFGGTITSSTSSSIVVDGDHVVSQALYGGIKLEDKTSFQGEVKAVNSTDSYFTLKLKSGVSVKVLISSSTVITLDGATKPLSSLEEGDEVRLTGELNSDGSVITASKVSAESEDSDDEEDDNDNDDKDGRKEFRGGFWGKIQNWFWR
ncbi:MAG: DUF5666 domain-containing protein [Minisyncoccia bacterium]